MFRRLYKDYLFRRFVSGAVFASAFVWVAVAFFDVDPEVIKVLLVYSIGLVVILAVGAVLLVPVIRLFGKPRSDLLDRTLHEPPGSSDRDEDASRRAEIAHQEKRM